MNNPQIDELCQRIYKNHRQALELIFERVGNPTSGILADAEDVLRKDPRWHVFYRTRNVVDFIPQAWLGWLGAWGLDRKDDPRSWFVLRFELYEGEGKLDFYAEVRRISDVARRREIVGKLIEEGPNFGFRHSGREFKDNYTRISGRERIIQWTNDEPEPEAIRTAVKKKLDELFPRLESVPRVVKPLLGAVP